MPSSIVEAYFNRPEHIIPELSDPVMAEAIYLYCEQPHVSERLEGRCMFEDLSLAEFVQKYELASFRWWYKHTYNVL